MSRYDALEASHQPDGQALVDNLRRKGTPARAHHMELFHDGEIAQAIVDRYDLTAGLDREDPHFADRQHLALYRFLGFDYVHVYIGASGDLKLHRLIADDTADRPHAQGRGYQDEHTGPIMSWEDFERFDWPDPHAPQATDSLEWYSENLPDDMVIIAGVGGHFAEWLCWLMGYETLCFSLYDQRDLVEAIEGKLREIFRVTTARALEFDRVSVVWGSDDMGFKTQPLISPADARRFFLPGHKELAKMSHDAGRVYMLHACGNLNELIDDLIDDVQIDAKHSFEDTIEDVREVKHTYGQRIALVGGIDVDFLCRADESAIRKRVRETLDVCMPRGGFVLGSGNSVANYVPVDNYLAMVDEGWRWSGR